jgi:predicted GNAT family N-acyltransferase
MKGFPNQIAELDKLARGMRCLARLVYAGDDAKDYAVFGEALVRDRIAGTGHKPQPIETYLTEQRRKSPDRQSIQTTPRGLRELYRLLGFIDDSGPVITITTSGRQAVAFADTPPDRTCLAAP